MVIRKITAIYSIIIGIIMIGMWTFFLVAGLVPEFSANSIAISLHLVAEFLTAILLLISGIGLIMKQKWGFNVNLVALGMLLYTVIVSPGYYAKPGGEVFLGMFGVLIVLTAIFVGASLLKENELRLNE